MAARATTKPAQQATASVPSNAAHPRLSALNPSNKKRSSASTTASNPASSASISSLLLSASEKQYILEGCRDNCRLDGRRRHDVRSYTLVPTTVWNEHNNTGDSDNAADHAHPEDADAAVVVALSNGSSRILMGGGATHVLCSVKAELVQPSLFHPFQGAVDIHVDSLTTGINNSSRQQQQVLTSTLSKLLSDHLVPLQDLCVVPYHYVWRLNVDLLVLSANGGSLVDVCSRAIRRALQTTVLPHLTPSSSSSQKQQQQKQQQQKQPSSSSSAMSSSSSDIKSAKVDLHVDGDMQHAQSLPGIDSCPIIVTVLVCKCPPTFRTCVLLVDATLPEEACAECCVHVALEPCTGKVVSLLQTMGPLEANVVKDVISTAVQASRSILEQDKEAAAAAANSTMTTTTLLQDQFQFR